LQKKKDALVVLTAPSTLRTSKIAEILLLYKSNANYREIAFFNIPDRNVIALSETLSVQKQK